MTRRKLTTLDKLKIVAAQARCPLCGEPLGDLAGLEFDHDHALALGGADELANLRALHRACHLVKTNGLGGCSAGSDKNRIAKVVRNAERNAEFNRVLAAKAGDGEVQPRRKRGRIPSRPFQRRKERA